MIVLSHCIYCDESTYVEEENAQDCCCDECFKILHHEEYQENQYDKYFNKGNNCDDCSNQYLSGKDGDSVGCWRYDNGLECQIDKEFILFIENK